MTGSNQDQPINYVAKLGNLNELFRYYCPHESAKLLKTLGPGSLPVHEALAAARRRAPDDPIPPKALDAEKQEYWQAAGLPVRPPLDLDLPRPIRGQHTFGYSWVAFNYAAKMAGCQEQSFSLDVLDALVETGLWLLGSKVAAWRQYPLTFLEEADKWDAFEWDVSNLDVYHNCGARHDQNWRNHFVFVILIDHTHDRMMHWLQLRDCVERLRKAGMAPEGLAASMQLASNETIRDIWGEAVIVAARLCKSVTCDLRDAYACSVGKELVLRENRHNCAPRSCCDALGWSLRSDDLSDLLNKDHFAGTLARYCLEAGSDYGPCCHRPHTKEWMEAHSEAVRILDSKPANQLLLEDAMKKHPEKVDTLPVIVQDLLSKARLQAEKNLVMDLEQTMSTILRGKIVKSLRLNTSPARSLTRNGDRIHVNDSHVIMRDVRVRMMDYASYPAEILNGQHSNPDIDLASVRFKGPYAINGLFDGPIEKRAELAEMYFEHFEHLWSLKLFQRFFPSETNFKHCVVGQDDQDISGSFPTGTEHLYMCMDVYVARLPGYTWLTHQPFLRLIPIVDHSESTAESFPLSKEPLAISSRKYLQDAGLWESAQSDPALGCGALTQRAANNVDATFDTSLAPKPAPHPYQVNRKDMKILKKLLVRDNDANTGQIRWDDLDKLIRHLGFSVELRGGSIACWIPPRSVGLPMTVHRPHPEVSIGPVKSKVLGATLRRMYGWTMDNFIPKITAGASEVANE